MITPSSTRKVSAKLSPTGCLAILGVQPSRSRPLNSECQPLSDSAAPAWWNAAQASRSAASGNDLVFMIFLSDETAAPVYARELPGQQRQADDEPAAAARSICVF